MSGGARTSGRQRATVEYNEAAAYRGAKSGGAGPAWARELDAKSGSQGSKENSRPRSAPAPAAKPGGQARKPAVAQKGRDAGLERLPIEDAKGVKPSGKARGGDAAPPAAAGKQVLPGVFVKAGPAEAAKAGSGSGKAAAAHKPAAPPAKSTAGSSGRGVDAGASGKRKAAPPAAAAKPAAAAGSGSDAKRQKAASVWPAAAAAAVAEEVLAAPGGAEELADQFSGNFRALQVEYDKLQALYEDLKAAKIDEEVQQLLEQQNRYVSEHGQKAAELVERYKREAQHHADTAAQLGGEALVEQCDRLQADLMNCQQALLDKEAESLEKDKRLAEMAARLAFLERYARVYDASDKCIQTDGLPGEDASAQFPSLQSSGMEMLQAHAMVPEGTGGGSIYRRPKAAHGPQLPDTSYTLPACTALAAGAATGGAAAAAGGARISGSDMDLTGEAAAQAQAEVQDQGLQTELQEQQQQQQHLPPQQARRQSLQPAAGRLAHAAAGPGLRPPSAESQVQPQGILAAQQPQQVQRQAAARRQTIAPVAAAAAAAGGVRRVSAPPAPIDRELRFTSVSTADGQAPLAVVLEDEPFGSDQDAAAGSAAQQQQQAQQRQQEEEPPFEFPQPPAAAPAPSQLTAPTAPAAARGGAPTPGSVPPRELAITALTGLVATPMRGGFYRYADQASGYVFELGPAPPDSADLGAVGEPCLCYRPIALGAMAPLLPEHFHEEVCFVESQRTNFFRQVMHSLAQRH